MIDWKKQHCGVHQAFYDEMVELMPDIESITNTFPESECLDNFIWDVKVHMLMPTQYPCLPAWHCDNVPRVDGKQDYTLCKLDSFMYLWASGAPLTEFRKDGKNWFIKPQTWVKFNQLDEHRGHVSEDFTWRAFIRATPKDYCWPERKKGHNPLRRHSQVYLDVSTFDW